MTYDKRSDGRDWKEVRPVTAKAGVIKNADGSGYFKIGNTEAYAAVFGPRNLHPRFMQDPKKGVLRVNYSMMPFSGSGDRVRPGPSRRSKELNLVIQQALEPALNLDAYPNTVVDVFIELPQTDAGTRCAGICAASIALADAGFTMKDMVTALSVGRVEDKMLVDPNYVEDSHEDGVDIPIAMMPNSGTITLLQLDGIIKPEMIISAMRDAIPEFKKIADTQRAALKARYTGE